MVALLALLAGCRTLPPGDDAHPDVVLISIDSLRRDHVHAYGYRRDTTPTLDRLAERGARFTRALSASPWTLPAHMTMMTGLWPTEHGVVESDRRLAEGVPTVAERLKAGGYATAAFTSTIFVSGDYGFDRGFDTYADHDLTEKQNLAHAVRTPQLVTEAMDWARKLPEHTPAFVFLHTYDAHYPYAPPEPWNTKYNRALSDKDLRYRTYDWFQAHPLSKRKLRALTAQYDESIRYVDDSLKPLIDTWSRDRNVVFIVVSDHGEELGERGSWGHGHTLYREVLQVPLIVSGAGIPAGVRSERVGHLDLAATIAGIAGVPWGIGDGRDLREPVPDRPFWPETSRFTSNQLGLVDGPAAAATATLWDGASGAVRQYALGTDPKEKHPLATPDPAAAARILAHLGTPWHVDAGQVSSTGVLVTGGAAASNVTGPADFGGWPPDATLTWTAADGTATTVAGDLAALPDGVRHAGPIRAAPYALSTGARQALEALGYTEPTP